jgi:hypothetical protein
LKKSFHQLEFGRSYNSISTPWFSFLSALNVAGTLTKQFVIAPSGPAQGKINDPLKIGRE